MARQAKAWVSGVEISWNGELADDFWPMAEQAVGRPLSDEMRQDLAQVVRSYSTMLHFEFFAAPLSDQKEALSDAIEKADALLLSLQALETQEMGHAVSNLISEEWEADRGRQAEFDRMESRSAEAMSLTFQSWGLHADAASDAAWSFIRDWHSNLLLQRPTLGPDFMEHLFELRQALGLSQRRLRVSPPLTKDGDAFDELIGNLFQWSDTHHLNLRSYPNNVYGNHGKMTDLVKLVAAQVPNLLGEDGKLLDRQMRPSDATDATWAQRIVTARKRFDSKRPDTA